MTRRNWFLIGAAVVAILATGVVASQFASSQPDGLEFVAEEQGFAGTAEDHTLGDTPLADYGGNLSTSSGAATAFAGIVGIAVTAGVVVGLFYVARSSRDDSNAAP